MAQAGICEVRERGNALRNINRRKHDCLSVSRVGTLTKRISIRLVVISQGGDGKKFDEKDVFFD